MGHSPGTQRPPTAIVKVCYQGLIWRIPTLDFYNPNTTVPRGVNRSLDPVCPTAVACLDGVACASLTTATFSRRRGKRTVLVNCSEARNWRCPTTTTRSPLTSLGFGTRVKLNWCAPRKLGCPRSLPQVPRELLPYVGTKTGREQLGRARSFQPGVLNCAAGESGGTTDSPTER